jgi:hypothetical protein
MIASFIIHYLGWQASNMFWGHLSEMLLYRASEATTFVNTYRLLGTWPLLRSRMMIAFETLDGVLTLRKALFDEKAYPQLHL